MKKSYVLCVLLSASLLASCAIGNLKGDSSSSSEESEVSLPSGTSVDKTLAKAQLAATLATMKDTKTFGLNLKGNAKVKLETQLAHVDYSDSDPSVSTSKIDGMYDFENLVLNAAVKDLGQSSCEGSANFAADYTYNYAYESDGHKSDPITVNGPISGKAYYESGLLYLDGTALVGSFNPSMSSEAIAKAKVKGLFDMSAFDWTMVLQGMKYLEQYGFEDSALCGENGTFYYVYSMSAEEILKKMGYYYEGAEIKDGGVIKGDINVWVAYDSTKIINVGVASDVNFDYVIKSREVKVSYGMSSTSDSTVAVQMPDMPCKGEVTSDLKGVLTYNEVSVEKVSDPDSYIYQGPTSQEDSSSGGLVY